MSDTPSASPSWKDFIPAVTLLLAIVGLLVAGGQLLGKVDEHSREISALKTRIQRREDEQSDIKANIAAINAKLDLLIQRAPVRPLS